MQIKVNDVFKFSYHPQEGQGWDSRTHCFEGLLIVRKNGKGEIRLEDTYWGISPDGHNQRFKPEEAEEKGVLTHYFNLDKVDPVSNYERKYYADEDLFFLSRQHACAESCRYTFIRKRAKRSQTKMLEGINKKIMEAKRKVESVVEDVASYSELKAKIEKGDLGVHI